MGDSTPKPQLKNRVKQSNTTISTNNHRRTASIC